MSVFSKVGILVCLGLFCVAGLGVVHHYLVSGRWFDMVDLVHHEPIIVGVATLGLGVLLGSTLRR